NTPPLLGGGIPAHDVEGPHEASILLERRGQGVLLRIRLELLDEEGRRHPAEFHRSDDPHHVVPPLQNPEAIDPVSNLRLEAGIPLHIDGPRRKEAAIAQVTEARSEAIPQEVK